MAGILIIGDYNPFTKELINKFHKERWQIFFLTNREDVIKEENVFEQFNFPYTSDNIREIINSSRPDLVIFTGAFDSCFNWKNENLNDTSNSYIAGLNNILTYTGLLGVKSFIYLSYEGVFENEYFLNITEEFMPHPTEIKNITILQGENMTRSIGASTNTVTTVIRIAGMYGIPESRTVCNNFLTKMCIEALDKGRINISSKQKITALYIKDAVEALYYMIKQNDRQYDLYHLSSMNEISQASIGQIIKESCSYPVELVDKSIGFEQRVILSNERFSEEFPFEIKNDYKEVIPKIMSFVSKNKNLFLDDKDLVHKENIKFNILKWFKIFIPFIEAMMAFTLVYFLDIKTLEISYLSNLNLYLLYVLVFSLIHGRQQAIFTSFLCVLGILYNKIILPSQFNVLLDGNLYLELVQIFLVGLPVGHLKDNYYEMIENKDRTIDLLKGKLRDILKINSKNAYIKDYYAEKIISSKESIGKIYGITSKLQDAKLGEVQFAALDTIISLMGTKDAAIYFVTGTKYCRLVSASSQKAMSLGKTIEINNYDELFDEIKEGNVYINRTFNSQLPMMANALFDDNKNMRIIIFIWSLPYDKMTLDNANLLNVIGDLFYSYFDREINYIDALSYQRYIEGTKVLQTDAFIEIIDLYSRAKEKGYAESCIIYVKCDRENIIKESDKINILLRATDYIGLNNEGNYMILLTSTSEEEAIYVKDRLIKAGFIIIK